MFFGLAFFLSAHLEAQPGKDMPPALNRAQSSLEEAMSAMDRAFIEADTEPTPEDLYFLGRAVAANILAAYEPYTVNPELTQYVNLICQALLVHSPKIELYAGAFVLILDSQELNAFASPGGHIFITKGLLEVLNTEDMIAAVIAHELAHISLKHGASMIAEMRITEDAAALANRALEFSGRNSPAAQQLMSLRDSVSVVMDTLLKNGYSQSQEFEADREALILLSLSGYNPRALVEVLEVMQRMPNSGNIAINATHPSPAERIANVARSLGNRQFRDESAHRASRFRNR